MVGQKSHHRNFIITCWKLVIVIWTRCLFLLSYKNLSWYATNFALLVRTRCKAHADWKPLQSYGSQSQQENTLVIPVIWSLINFVVIVWPSCFYYCERSFSCGIYSIFDVGMRCQEHNRSRGTLLYSLSFRNVGNHGFPQHHLLSVVLNNSCFFTTPHCFVLCHFHLIKLIKSVTRCAYC